MSMQIKKPLSNQPLPKNAKKVFKGVIFDVYQWELPGYDGKMRTFEKVKRPDTAMVIAVTEDGKIILGREEQPGKESSLGLVGGRIDEGEDPLGAAKRELLEETGYEGKEWALFDAFQPVSKMEWVIYTFIAKGCHKVAEQDLDGAEKIDLLLVSFDEFVEMILRNELDEKELKIRFLEAKLDPAKMAEIKQQFGL